MPCRDSLAAQLRNGGLGRHLLGRPRKAPLFRVPLSFQSSGGQSPPSGKKISGFQPEILLGRAIRRGSLPLAKEAELDGFQPPSFAMAALAAVCSAVPEKLRFSGFPYFSILRRAEPAFRQENFRLSAGNFAWTRHSARLASARKRPNWTAFSRPASRWRP